MAKSQNFFIYNFVVLRDTLFFIAVAMLPLSLVWFKVGQVTWYVASGYLYGLMMSSIMKLVDKTRRRETHIGVFVQMIKILILLASFTMILLSGPRYVVRFDDMTIAFCAIVFLCLYYERYIGNKQD